MACSGYIESILDPTTCKTILKKAVKTLKKHKSKFDAIAIRGNSGAIVSGHLITKLSKNLILCRKEENYHAINKIEYSKFDDRFIIVDDFIESGSTVVTILEELLGQGFDKTQFSGIYLYNDDVFYSPKEFYNVKDELSSQVLKRFKMIF